MSLGHFDQAAGATGIVRDRLSLAAALQITFARRMKNATMHFCVSISIFASVLATLLAGPTQAQPVIVEEAKWASTEISLLVPDEIKPTGEHGTIVLEGEVTDEKRIGNLEVAQSSRSSAIDQFALQRFANARVSPTLLEHNPARIRLTVAVYNIKGLDFGSDYSCRQAVLDADWYAKAFNTTEIEKSSLYYLLRGGGTIFGNKKLAFAKDDEKFDLVWRHTLMACREFPDEKFVGVLLVLGNR
ncbi:TonB family protein [Sphingomonas cavernae]|nr:TonB family protein [Sphingomonas cavernae]